MSHDYGFRDWCRELGESCFKLLPHEMMQSSVKDFFFMRIRVPATPPAIEKEMSLNFSACELFVVVPYFSEDAHSGSVCTLEKVWAPNISQI